MDWWCYSKKYGWVYSDGVGIDRDSVQSRKSFVVKCETQSVLEINSEDWNERHFNEQKTYLKSLSQEQRRSTERLLDTYKLSKTIFKKILMEHLVRSTNHIVFTGRQDLTNLTSKSISVKPVSRVQQKSEEIPTSLLDNEDALMKSNDSSYDSIKRVGNNDDLPWRRNVLSEQTKTRLRKRREALESRAEYNDVSYRTTELGACETEGERTMLTPSHKSRKSVLKNWVLGSIAVVIALGVVNSRNNHLPDPNDMHHENWNPEYTTQIVKKFDDTDKSHLQPRFNINAKPAIESLELKSCAENLSCYGDISDLTNRPKTVHIDGYYRNDGTYVRGHYRGRPK